jgi:Asp-tRNA(Asn)/Glu-tRNA(Gln) amidotransferase A subunit family amidase
MSMDTAGLMARTVADAAALLNVLDGYDQRDPATEACKDRPQIDYTLALNPESLNGTRIGVLRKSADIHQAVDLVFEKAYLEARLQAGAQAGPDGIDKTLQDNQLDTLIAPTLGPAGVIDCVLGDRSIDGDVTFAPAVAGYPHLTVPMGQVHGLPVGLSFVRAQWIESKLIGYADAFEQATHARFSPRFVKSIHGGRYRRHRGTA